VISCETIVRLSGFSTRRNRMAPNQSLRLSGRRRFGSFNRRKQREFCCALKPGLANQFGYGSCRQPGCIVLNPQRVRGVVEPKAADAVNVFRAGQGKNCALCGRGGKGKEDIHRGHRLMIPTFALPVSPAVN